MTAAGRSRSAIFGKTAWIPEEKMDHADWIVAGRRLGAIGRCSQWWVGDWIRYGNAKWGEKYVEAARVTGYDVASLRNMAWVAAQFDLSLRSDKLTWSHHVLLAPFEPEEKRYWLERASAERFSVADLRIELRRRRPKEHASSVGADQTVESDLSKTMVCPRCGHTLTEAVE
ncbi:MAG TPA: hypothetical protein VHZ54_01005 [Solirubrobacterales bacterium]|nr:hypothetical protein [Solirubrobacterales bacterium]